VVIWGQVHKEVRRLLKVEIASNMSRFFSAARIDRILELLERNKSTEVASILSAIGKATDYELSGEFKSLVNSDFIDSTRAYLISFFQLCCFISNFHFLYLLSFNDH